MINPVAMIETRFNIQLKRVSRDEWAGPCPFCGGIDRWHFWEDKKNWWCRPGPGHCGQQGFLDDLFDELKQPTQEQLLQWRVAKLEKKQQEQERRLTRLEQMARCQDHVRYHKSLTEKTREYWFGEGIIQESIDRYLLGYCESCPTYRESPSYTIPVINRSKLENIRHRLVSPNGTGKYRPHMAGLGNSLFNVDLLDSTKDRILIVEGEKKSIVLAQSGFPNVGICGKRSFKREWLPWFEHVNEVIVALDPDATESAFKLAAIFGKRARIAITPVKIDDAIVKYGASETDIEDMIGWARRI